MDRDHATVLPSGTTFEGVGPDGARHVLPHVYRPQHGLRPDHAAALLARPDLCARLWREGIDPELHWLAAPADEMDAAIDGMLAETVA